MTDHLALSWNVGRWFGIQVRLHIILLLFAASKLLGAALDEQGTGVGATATWLGLLLLALIAHEAGHAAAAWWLGIEPEDVRLWPLGNLVSPFPSTARMPIAVIAAGPLVNLAVALLIAIGLAVFAGAESIFSPLGNTLGGGAPRVGTTEAGPVFAAPFTAVWLLGWFGYLNWVIFLANLIPAQPFDTGRGLRTVLAVPSYGGPSKDSMVAPWTAHVSAAFLFIVGLSRLVFHGELGEALILIGLALTIEVYFRSEARALEEGGFFEDSVFGYDFSEGYTSLEANTAKVRPYRESAIKRWRRRRSELRRQRRQAREAAQERRMDEILEKLHVQGRAALTDEEHRFLVRVSRMIRNRPKGTA